MNLVTSQVNQPLRVVLDTNVVLDWLVFRNRECSALTEAVVAGQVMWIASSAMRDELTHVLARGHLDAWCPDGAAVWRSWNDHCRELPVPAPVGASGRLRCSDPDDQKFIDFAVAIGARWLVSRDRAVLKLRRRLLSLGIDVVPPGGWHSLDADA